MKLFPHVRSPSVTDEDGVVSWATVTPSTADNQNKPSSEAASRVSWNRHISHGETESWLSRTDPYTEANASLRGRDWVEVLRSLQAELDEVQGALIMWKAVLRLQQTEECRVRVRDHLAGLEDKADRLWQDIEELEGC